ncbi:Attractin [Liparis tanakae]|uniref:Attractin n=1 Tax=Liparis tanakae TaxID=230148 RepID=A0A4Z2EZV4_9TELE|nr:Attractin [Liparis tanakae]
MTFNSSRSYSGCSSRSFSPPHHNRLPPLPLAKALGINQSRMSLLCLQLLREMQQMASRPFATINVALETEDEPPDLIGGNVKEELLQDPRVSDRASIDIPHTICWTSFLSLNSER